MKRWATVVYILGWMLDDTNIWKRSSTHGETINNRHLMNEFGHLQNYLKFSVWIVFAYPENSKDLIVLDNCFVFSRQFQPLYKEGNIHPASLRKLSSHFWYISHYNRVSPVVWMEPGHLSAQWWKELLCMQKLSSEFDPQRYWNTFFFKHLNIFPLISFF